MVDTGAAYSCIDDSFFQRTFSAGKEVESDTSMRLVSAGNAELVIRGTVAFDCHCVVRRRTDPTNIRFYIIENLDAELILGRDFIHETRLDLNSVMGYEVESAGSESAALNPTERQPTGEETRGAQTPPTPVVAAISGTSIDTDDEPGPSEETKMLES